MYAIARPINGILLNGREYILDNDDNLMLFPSEQDAVNFLHSHGIDDVKMAACGIEVIPESEVAFDEV